MVIAKEQSKIRIPLFVDSYLAMVNDEKAGKDEFQCPSLRVLPGCPLMGNSSTLLTSPLDKIKSLWRCQQILIQNRNQLPAVEKIGKFFSHDFLIADPSEEQIPIVVLRYLDAELLGVRESNSGLPRVIGKYHRNKKVNHMTTGRPESRKRKYDDIAETVGNPENPGKVHIERPALRSPQDLVAVIKNLIKLVRPLRTPVPAS